MAARRTAADRKVWLKLAAVVVFGLGAGTALFFGSLRSTPKAVDVSDLARLVTHTGQPFDPGVLRGRYALLYFGFTYCPDACPTALAAMSTALKAVDGVRLQALFVSVDPQRDTPPVVAEYVAHFAPGLIGLTGRAADVQRVLRSFGVLAIERQDAKAPGGYSVDHSNEFVLLSPRGRLLQRIPGNTPASRLVEIVGREMREDS